MCEGRGKIRIIFSGFSFNLPQSIVCVRDLIVAHKVGVIRTISIMSSGYDKLVIIFELLNKLLQLTKKFIKK